MGKTHVFGEYKTIIGHTVLNLALELQRRFAAGVIFRGEHVEVIVTF